MFFDWIRQLTEQLVPPGEELPPVRTLGDLKVTLAEDAPEWEKQWRQEGIEQGVTQGIEQGLARERAILRRQAALRFGDEAASRVSRVVERIGDPEDLASAGDWLVRAADGDELVARLTRLAEGRDVP